MQFHVACVDKGRHVLVEVGACAVLRDAATRVVESLQDVIHRVSSVHNEQVLVDGKHTVGLETLGHLGVTVETRDRELLLGALVLFHEDLVLNLPIAHVWLANIRIRCLPH